MQGYAGVIVRHSDRILLVQEPDFFTRELVWSFPSGHIEPGESPVAAAVRELAEESGCVIDPAHASLALVADVRHGGETLSRSWNFVADTLDDHLLPDDPDGLVKDARWFDADRAAQLLAAGSHPPKTEPAIAFLTSGRRDVHWTFDLDDLEARPLSFRWDPPIALNPHHHAGGRGALDATD